MQLQEIKDRDVLTFGAKVIHRTTLEVGEYVGECLGFGKCKIVYGDKGWYPQPKRNIMLITNQ